MGQRILVTGGAGFIGSHLVRALSAEGHSIVVLDDLSMGKRENVPTEVEFIEGDVRSADDVRQAIDGAEVVFHEAARVSIRSSVTQFYEDAEINLMGTLNLLRCCADSKVRKLVYASSMAVYDDCATATPIDEDYTLEPQSPYGVSKLAGEKYCHLFARANNIDCHVLRYFNTYGPGQTFTPYVGVVTIFVNGLLKGEAPTVFGDGEQRRDFIHVSDIVQANLCALKSKRQSGTYNVGTGVATSVNEIAALLCERIAPGLKPKYAPQQRGELRNSVADLTRIEAELGYSPKVSLENRINEVIEACREKIGR